MLIKGLKATLTVLRSRERHHGLPKKELFEIAGVEAENAPSHSRVLPRTSQRQDDKPDQNQKQGCHLGGDEHRGRKRRNVGDRDGGRTIEGGQEADQDARCNGGPGDEQS